MKLIFIICLMFQLTAFGQSMPAKYVDFYDALMEFDFEEKQEILDKAIRNNPNDPWFYWMKASFYTIQGDDIKVKENYEKALAIDSDFVAANASYARYMLSEFEQDTVKQKRALIYINRAIKLDPNQSGFLVDRGNILLNLGDYLNAENDANKALKNGIRYDEAVQLKAKVLYFSNRKEELKTFLNQNKLIDSEMMSTDFALLLGTMYEEFGDQKTACKIYKNASHIYEEMEIELPQSLVDRLKNCK